MIGRAASAISNAAMNATLQAAIPRGNLFFPTISASNSGPAIDRPRFHLLRFYRNQSNEAFTLCSTISFRSSSRHSRVILLIDAASQPKLPPDNVFRPDRPAETSLGSKKRGNAPPPIHGI
ncbi:uncharacterized protein LOC118345831, partial [Juglans regia]|uniref:Uncharacterized protein LOC118345831 n=1 Tax=Juglans regia TaxID=51240 RepID=A0A6P9E4C9_JUGRE